MVEMRFVQGFFFEELGSYGSYAGLDPSTKLNAESDVKCSIRFQTTFLPMEAAGKLEFATETGQILGRFGKMLDVFCWHI